MKITLNNQEVVSLTTTQIPYHADLTIEKLCYFLDIKPTAIILIDLMKFHLNTVERMNQFADRMLYEDSPLSLLTKMRKEDVDSYSHTDKATFVCDYYRDKKSAFKRLFQEPAHEWKMNKYKTDDPELIYDTYVKLGKYSHMTEVSLFI
ncbi:hypothetical protein [Paenibacillus sp. NPDC055715]